jgi:biopolymer transport protein ExbD
MLVLLIIFMVTAPALFQQLQVNLPKSAVGQAEVSEGLVVTITQGNVVMVGRDRIPAGEFAARFSALRAGLGERPVFLKADEAVPYGKVVEVVGQIRSSGVEKLGLVVESTATAPRR